MTSVSNTASTGNSLTEVNFVSSDTSGPQPIIPFDIEGRKNPTAEMLSLSERTLTSISLQLEQNQTVDFTKFIAEFREEFKKLKSQVIQSNKELKLHQFKTAILRMKASGISDGEILCVAVNKKDLDFLRFVLCGPNEYRMDVNEVDKLGGTPLHYAADQKDIAIADFLLAHGANPNLFENKTGDTAIHKAVLNNNLAMVGCLVKWKADVNIIKNTERGFSPLHYAARDGYLAIVEYLLNNGAMVDQCSWGDNYTAIYLASYNNRTTIVSLLLARGADPTIKNTKGESPLNIARTKEFSSIVIILNDHQHIEKKLSNPTQEISYAHLLEPFESKERDSINLQKAAKDGHLHKVIGLVKRGASVNFQNQEHGASALHWASFNGFFKIVEFLLENGADCNLEELSGDGFSLLYSSIQGHLEITKLLVTKKAFVNKCSGESSFTALHSASEHNHKEIVSFLLNNGADPHIIDIFGETPLSKAIKNNHNEVVVLLQEYLKSNPKNQKSAQEKIPYTVCIEIGPSASLSDYLDYFRKAADQGHWQKVVQIVNCSATNQVNTRFIISEEILTYRYKKIALFLLEKGYLFAADKYGQISALHYAAEMNLTSDFRRLLNSGADHILQTGGMWDSKSKRKTVREIATDNNHVEILAILDEHESKLQLPPPPPSIIDSIKTFVFSSKEPSEDKSAMELGVMTNKQVKIKNQPKYKIDPYVPLQPVYVRRVLQ